jgi:hypothetical protein
MTERQTRNHGHHEGRCWTRQGAGRRCALTRCRGVAGALGVAGAASVGAGLTRPESGFTRLVSSVAAQSGATLCEPVVLGLQLLLGWPRRRELTCKRMTIAHRLFRLPSTRTSRASALTPRCRPASSRNHRVLPHLGAMRRPASVLMATCPGVADEVTTP